MTELLTAWQDFTITPQRVRAVGDSVLAAVRYRGLGRGSTVPTEMEAHEVWTFRGRSVIRFQVFRQEADALEALGLTE